jgi:transcriptional regulator with XRE-family HTH domain
MDCVSDSSRIESLGAFRKSQGFGQKQIAYNMGVTISSVRGWEGGSRTPSIHHLVKLAGSLGCNLVTLFLYFADRVEADEKNREERKRIEELKRGTKRGAKKKT